MISACLLALKVLCGVFLVYVVVTGWWFDGPE